MAHGDNAVHLLFGVGQVGFYVEVVAADVDLGGSVFGFKDGIRMMGVIDCTDIVDAHVDEDAAGLGGEGNEEAYTCISSVSCHRECGLCRMLTCRVLLIKAGGLDCMDLTQRVAQDHLLRITV